MSDELDSTLLLLADERKPVRALPLSALSDMPRGEIEQFRLAWARLSPERRHELIAELVELSDADIHLNFFAILRECLSDPDDRVRSLAIEGLWEDNRPTLVSPLARMAGADPASEVRALAAQALGRFVYLGVLGDISEHLSGEAEQALRAAWSRPGEATEVRRRAMESLAYTGGAEVRDQIESAYYDEDPLMRQSAVFAMGRTAERRWANTVMAELRSEDAPMRFEATQAAGELGLMAAVTPLIQLLEDNDSTVRQAAAVALGQIGGAQAKRALQACTRGDDEALAEAARDALAELSFQAEPLSPSLLEVGAQPPGRAEAADETEDDEDDRAGDDGDEADDLFDDEMEDFEMDEDEIGGWESAEDDDDDDADLDRDEDEDDGDDGEAEEHWD